MTENPTLGQQLGNLTKEYFFFTVDTKTGTKTGDAIGVRVIKNDEDLSPLRWYQKTFGKDPSGSTMEVDGYPAIREGRTVYVAADYLPNAASQSYPYIYVFSYTDKAGSATVAMFEQLLLNLHFNTVIPSTDERFSDLRTDVKRVFAYEEIIYALDAYKKAHSGAYPTLESGTYLSSYSMTSWPSWQQTLGAQLGISMPKDPLNLWNTTWPGSPCTGASVDPTTCWDATAKVMHFPNEVPSGAPPPTFGEPPHSTGIAYHYTTNATGKPDAQLYGVGSVYFWAHRSNFTQSFAKLGPKVSRSTNICPAGQSQCYGFDLVLDSADDGGGFTNIVNVRVKQDATAPTVSITSPATGSTVSGMVEVIATADDGTGSGVGAVNFLVKNSSGSQQTSGSIGAPSADGKYHWTFNSRQFANGAAASGTGVTLSVTASDKAGNASNAISATYGVQNAPGDQIPPILTLVAPSADGQVSGTPTVSANASDTGTNASGMAKVEFYLGTSKVGESDCLASCPPPPFSASVDTTVFPDGSYTYSAVAYDKSGNTSIKQLTLQVNNGGSGGAAPTVNITFPDTSSTLSGSSTNVVADVIPASGSKGIDYVSFTVDSETTPRATLTSAPYTFTWLLRDATTGKTYDTNTHHKVTVTGYDRSGLSTSTTADFTYGTAVATADIQPPIITVGSPKDGDTFGGIKNINAVIADNVSVQRVELYIDNTAVPFTGCGIGPSCTLSYDWNTVFELAGSHSIAISAYDSSNNASTVALNVTVSNSVIMSFSAPGSDATVQDGTCTNSAKSCTSDANCGNSYFACTTPTDFSRTCDGYFDTSCAPAKCVSRWNGGVCSKYSGTIRIAVSKTCRTDQLLSNVKLYTDPYTSTSTPFTTITNCTNGLCTYNWLPSTLSDGPHTLYAIGTATKTDGSTCMGGAKVNVTVNNNLNLNMDMLMI